MSSEYRFYVRLAGIVTLVLVSLMIAAKTWAWLVSGSAAMLGSLTDSLLDISASMMSFMILGYALQPADDDHRFGHGKAEALAGLGQAAFIAGSACLLSFHGIERLYNPTPVTHSGIAIGVSIFAVVCTLLLVAVQFYVVKRTKSIAIKADSLHYKGDLLLNLAVLAAVLLSDYGLVYADAIFAILVAGYLLSNGWGIARESADHLMDKELPAEEQTQILNLATAHPEVLGVHELRTRQSGKMKFVQLHLELPAELPLSQAHRITEEVMRTISAAFPLGIDLLIHQDPVVSVKHSLAK
ncbi:cation diffusion facilitator family transporter [Pseudoalteromonas fenneropenaei]|uniref:Cation diffusion facilitator family transporter n=1 Tax=Pseudoalteromonas fenneropenaei TaxID=1737459 RepID=A0ABV7CHD5_9GAMM